MDQTALNSNDCLEALQQRIGYRFRDRELLQLALIHKSYANEQQLEEHCGNERLEFLGDAVIELVISHILMEQSQGSSEGHLSKMRASIVNTDSLSSYLPQLCVEQLPAVESRRGGKPGPRKKINPRKRL